MAEKWTAADEKLWAELEGRRSALRTEWRKRLFDTLTGTGMTGIYPLTDYMIENAVEVSAALEPFVLAAGGKDNG